MMHSFQGDTFNRVARHSRAGGNPLQQRVHSNVGPRLREDIDQPGAVDIIENLTLGRL